MPSPNDALASRRPRRRSTGAVAVFDLDRTLLRGSSLVDLGRALVERRVVGRALVARHAVGAAVFARRGLGGSALDRVREQLLAAAAGRPMEELCAAVKTPGAPRGSFARATGVANPAGAIPSSRRRRRSATRFRNLSFPGV